MVLTNSPCLLFILDSSNTYSHQITILIDVISMPIYLLTISKPRTRYRVKPKQSFINQKTVSTSICIHIFFEGVDKHSFCFSLWYSLDGFTLLFLSFPFGIDIRILVGIVPPISLLYDHLSTLSCSII